MPATKSIAVRNLRAARWTSAEDDLLLANIEHPPAHISKRLQFHGFRRSEIAVEQRIRRMRYTSERTIWSGREFALLMGVDKNTVRNWIRLGWLKTSRRHDERSEMQGGHEYLITPRAALKFFRDHPNVFTLRKVDQDWFLDLVLN